MVGILGERHMHEMDLMGLFSVLLCIVEPIFEGWFFGLYIEALSG